MEGPVAVEQTALCGTADLGVSRQTLVCATCLTPDTVMTQCALPLQLYLPDMAPQLYWKGCFGEIIATADTYALTRSFFYDLIDI